MGLPDGFKSDNRRNVSAWVVKQEGTVVHGRLLERIEKRNGQAFYIVELLAPVKAIKGEDRVEVTLGKGDLACLDETYDLESWKGLAVSVMEYGAAYEVYAEFKGKIQLEGGKTKWDVEFGHKELRPPKVKANRTRDNAPGDEDIPF